MGTTHIAYAVDIAEEKAQFDTEIKNVLSNKYILAWIMSRTASEFSGMPIQDIVQCIEGEPLVSKVFVHPGKTNESIIGRDTQDKVPNEGEARFDILFHAIAPSGEKVKIILNVEAQKNFYPGYDLVTRGIYYGARLISSQKDREFTDDNYDDINKVYSIWICMNAPKYLQNTITEYKMEQHKLYGNYSRPARYDLLHVIMICLGSPEDADYQSNNHQKLIRLLSVLADEHMTAGDKLHILDKEYDIAATRELKGRVNNMCNWSDGIVDRVTERVTKQVTQQVTQQVGASSVEKVMRGCNVSLEKACEILQIKLEDYHLAKSSM